MCMTNVRAAALCVQALDFCLPEYFFFFWWSETRRVSLHLARASCLWLTGWRTRVGRNCLNFAPGVVQNWFRVGRNSSARRLTSASSVEPRVWDFGLRIAQPLRFAAVTGAQNSLVWVVRMCSDLDTGHIKLPLRQAQGRRPARSGSAAHRLNGWLLCMANSRELTADSFTT
jgi:hypothetical protein